MNAAAVVASGDGAQGSSDISALADSRHEVSRRRADRAAYGSAGSMWVSSSHDDEDEEEEEDDETTDDSADDSAVG